MGCSCHYDEANKVHDFRAPGCDRLSVEQQFFVGQAMAPGKTGKGNRVEFLPLDRVCM
jgi:hypothetical protein